MKFKKHIDELYSVYMSKLCEDFDESLESISAKPDGKNSWTWEYDGIKYRASIVKINNIYDFMFGADRNGTIVTGDTHSGHPLKAFAGALDALKQFIQRDKPKKWEYCGFYTRDKLYDLFYKRIEREFPYKMYNKHKDGFMIYYQFEKGDK